MLNTKRLLVLGIAGVLCLGAASQPLAAPVVSSGAAIKAAAADDTVNVQWRGWGGGWRGGWGGGGRRGWGWGGLGAGLGVGVGAALAAPYYGGYGCGPYGACGGYGDVAYAPAVVVVPAPVLAVPAYGYGGPWGWRRGWGGW